MLTWHAYSKEQQVLEEKLVLWFIIFMLLWLNGSNPCSWVPKSCGKPKSYGFACTVGEMFVLYVHILLSM